MWETTITNYLEEKVVLKEGYGGSFSPRETLAPGYCYLIRYDGHSTYREYIIVGPDHKEKRLGSDLIIENSAVEVVGITNEQRNWDLLFTKRPPKTESGSSCKNPGFLTRKWNKVKHIGSRALA